MDAGGYNVNDARRILIMAAAVSKRLYIWFNVIDSERDSENIVVLTRLIAIHCERT